MPKLLALLLIPLALGADERWIDIRSGPFQVLTDAGDRQGRDVLAQFEQLRWAIGGILSKQDAKIAWPVRIVVLKRWTGPSGLALVRDAYTGAMPGGPVPPALLRDCVRLLIEGNSMRMPAEIESGLEAFYSTEEVRSTSIVIGKPVPPAERSLAWARIHLLSVDQNYYGKMRVLLYNLQQGGDPDPAFRNAFGKSTADIDKQAAAYLAAGNFGTAEVSGRPLSPLRDFSPKPADAVFQQLVRADLLPAAESQAAYQAILTKTPGTAGALEGLGLLAVRAHDAAAAQQYLESAVNAGSTNARVYVELARLTSKAALLEKAAQLNPNWAEPHFLLAQQSADPAQKLRELKAATQLEPRNAHYWQALAETCIAQNLYADAGKAWAAARRASVDDAERKRIEAAERGIAEKRLAYEAAERKRAEEEKQRDIARLKAAGMAEIHEAEARANLASGQRSQGKVEQWWEGEAPSGKVRGQLKQIECLRGMARLVIESADKKITRLLIRDPSKVVVLSGGTLDLACGPQRRVREVVVEYYPRHEARLSTAGEVATIEYK